MPILPPPKVASAIPAASTPIAAPQPAVIASVVAPTTPAPLVIKKQFNLPREVMGDIRFVGADDMWNLLLDYYRKVSHTLFVCVALLVNVAISSL
jgi:hypothetical protein